MTVSDTAARDASADASGPVLRTILERDSDAYRIVVYDIVPDDPVRIRDTVQKWCDELHIALVITTGGTGMGVRDGTPEVSFEGNAGLGERPRCCAHVCGVEPGTSRGLLPLDCGSTAIRLTLCTASSPGSRSADPQANPRPHARADSLFPYENAACCARAVRQWHPSARWTRRSGLPHRRPSRQRKGGQREHGNPAQSLASCARTDRWR